MPSTWLDSLGLEGTVRLRIMFSFDTFRQNPDWYAYLYLKTVNGDADAPYLLGSSKKGGSDDGCCDDCCCCQEDNEEDETDDSLV